MNKNICLTVEEWDRLIELLEWVEHPDKPYLLQKINIQLHYNPADVPLITIQLKDK